MTSNEYEYIIEQQKEIIKQQKDLIDKLLMRVNQIVIPIEKDKQVPNYPYPYYITPITCSTTTSTDTENKCTAPKGAICDGKCKDCCYHVIVVKGGNKNE